MSSKVVIINAFEPENFFIAQLSKAYDDALHERGITAELLFVNNMNFSFSPFPDTFTFDELEPDLQKSVELIQAADTVAFFTSASRDHIVPVFTEFVSRLFHLKDGGINTGIWGDVDAYRKVLRIITVLDDPETWKKFRNNRKASLVPVPRINFDLFGFGQIYSRTFGFLKDDMVLNEYALKCIKTMVSMAEKD
ncbi:hypothetical protein [Taibaiella chishuiensis]|uniref:NADPH-dependent FMN reductase n=1 Tax=Taibaiella chishuiensis TaxID=1434707 RepID=A0A2P8D814_9BACT|nr:hypothetical protein [Taibaiella chishuiensis]PSK93343.1 hypothetical protein B0I18_102313 [Taibaiella chishuiensis]